MRRHPSMSSLALAVLLAAVPACAVGAQDAGWTAEPSDGNTGGNASAAGGFAGASAGMGGSSGSTSKGGSAGSTSKGGSSGSAGKGGSAGASGTAGASSGGSSGSNDAAGGTAQGGSSGASATGCSDPSLTCQVLGSVGAFCAGANASPPDSAVDCTSGPQACAPGYDCLTNAGVGYCLEPCDAGGSSGSSGSAGAGTSDCSLVKNPSQSCCVDDVTALDCLYGDTPIDCSMFGQVCGWDSMIGYYTCVDGPAQSSPSGSEPRICGN